VRAIALVLLAACTVSEPAGDPFPVYVDLSTGPLLVKVAQPGGATMPATLDVLAPFTLIDRGAGLAVSRESTELDLFGRRTATSTDYVERAAFSVDLVVLHPCDPTSACAVGTVGQTTTPIQAVLGADALSEAAIRFDFTVPDLFVFPDIAGADDLRDKQCDARFPSPFRGGGTLVLGGADVDFSGRRIAIGACLEPATTVDAKTTGTDALFVMSTGIGESLLGATAYARYCDRHPCANADPTALPQMTVLLPSGPVTGGSAQIKSLALVANPSGTSRGPCGDLHANYCLADAANCTGTTPEEHVADRAVLCKNQSSCGAPATVELGASITVVVVPDDDPTLQALRAELRPDQPEVDGLLGTKALAALQLDVDYPNNRLLARCRGAACTARPTLGTVDAPIPCPPP
jgi:hypothetical protein